VDADGRAAGRLLPAAREGRALALQQLLSLPMWPGAVRDPVRAWTLHLSVPRLQLCIQLYLLVLALMGLEYVDADVRAAGRILLAAREGRARASLQWLSLLLWPGYVRSPVRARALHLSASRLWCLRFEQGSPSREVPRTASELMRRDGAIALL
jgi:hypothetical protein